MDCETRSIIDRFITVALDAVDPVRAVIRCLPVEGSILVFGGRRYDLDRFERIFVVGTGKASHRMALGVEKALGRRISGGLVVTKKGAVLAEPPARVRVALGGHPTPDEDGVAAAGGIAALLEPLGEKDLVVCVISGGGSALLTLPVEGVTLQDKQALTRELLKCGATINEINCLRKHLSRVKGGQLARMASPATVISLILSDVVGDPLDTIASGPTVPDPTTYAEALRVLERYGIVANVPPSIVAHLRAGAEGKIAETPKPGDPIFQRTTTMLVGSNDTAARALEREAQAAGFHASILTTFLEGEAREVAKVLAAMAKEVRAQMRPLAPPACLILGGETTVTIRGTGLGGRNQELALAAARALNGLQGVAIVSFGTDGGDGPTDSAGAIATGDTLARAGELGMDAEAYLANNDSYHFFERLGDRIVTGQTGTNVNDLAFILVR
jgi:glycerate 2-kinase